MLIPLITFINSLYVFNVIRFCDVLLIIVIITHILIITCFLSVIFNLSSNDGIVIGFDDGLSFNVIMLIISFEVGLEVLMIFISRFLMIALMICLHFSILIDDLYLNLIILIVYLIVCFIILEVSITSYTFNKQ